MTIYRIALPVLALLLVTRCSAPSPHADKLRQVEEMIERGDFAPANELLVAALADDEDSVELHRARVRLLVLADSPDNAYLAYKELAKYSQDDTVLMDLLGHEEPDARIAAARALGRVGSPNTVIGLTRATADDNREVRRAAVAALGEIRSADATRALTGALNDDWWFVRADAAQALGKIRDPQAAEPLFGALEDSDGSVRLAAENALLTLAGEPGTDPQVFASRADAENDAVRRIALVGMAIQGDRASTPGLIELAQSEDVKTRAQAVRALGKTTDPAAVEAVRAALEDSQFAVQAQAIEALGRYGDSDSVATLQAIADNDQLPTALRDRALAAIALIQQGR